MKCIIDDCKSETQANICNKCWFKLPLKFRQKWWKETDFATIKPTKELIIEANAHT